MAIAEHRCAAGTSRADFRFPEMLARLWDLPKSKSRAFLFHNGRWSTPAAGLNAVKSILESLPYAGIRDA